MCCTTILLFLLGLLRIIYYITFNRFGMGLRQSQVTYNLGLWLFFDKSKFQFQISKRQINWIYYSTRYLIKYVISNLINHLNKTLSINKKSNH